MTYLEMLTRVEFSDGQPHVQNNGHGEEGEGVGKEVDEVEGGGRGGVGRSRGEEEGPAMVYEGEGGSDT